MIDLHLHLDGSLTPEEILQLAALSHVPLPADDAAFLRPMLEAAPDCRNLGEYLEKFQLPLQVLQTKASMEQAVYFLIRRLAAQKLCYAEIRFAPQLHLQRGLTQRQVVSAAVAGLKKALDEFHFSAQLILCCMRGEDNLAANLETVRIAKEFLHGGACAVDLAGNEATYPTEHFAPVFALAKALEVPSVIHAGEAAGAESVHQALQLGARRIGHGIRSIEAPPLLHLLQQLQIPLETCYSSNLQTKAVASRDVYPLANLLKWEIPVTVNTDNMTVSNTSLRREFALLQQHFGLSFHQLQSLACNAADAAFVTPTVAAQLKERIRQEFSGWLRNSDPI